MTQKLSENKDMNPKTMNIPYKYNRYISETTDNKSEFIRQAIYEQLEVDELLNEQLGYTNRRMRIVTACIPPDLLKRIFIMVGSKKNVLYPSLSEFVRVAIRNKILKEIEPKEEEPEQDEEEYLKQMVREAMIPKTYKALSPEQIEDYKNKYEGF